MRWWMWLLIAWGVVLVVIVWLGLLSYAASRRDGRSLIEQKRERWK